MDSAILYISSRHCKHCETIMRHIDPSQIRIVDVSMQGSTVPTYIEEVPTITFDGRMYVGVENALHIIHSSLKHIVNRPPKKESNVESIHPNQMVSKDNKIKGALSQKRRETRHECFRGVCQACRDNALSLSQVCGKSRNPRRIL